MKTPRLAAALAICMSLPLVTAAGAAADAPLVYGWWSQTSLGGAALIAPDVPVDGLFVQNVPFGPAAVSALEFRLPPQGPDPVQTSITLQISGTPIITQPPVICAATSGFAAAQGGAWSDRPGYDCSRSVVGVVDAAQTQVKFAVDPLVSGSTLSLVVVAGGPVDRVPLKRPDFGTLTQTYSGTVGAVGPVALPSTTPTAPLPVGPDVTEVPVLPRVDIPATTSTSSPPDDVVRTTRVAAAPRTPHKEGNTAIGVVGLLLVVLGIIYWSDGFGVLPVRSSRFDPSYKAE